LVFGLAGFACGSALVDGESALMNGEAALFGGYSALFGGSEREERRGKGRSVK
jgi:hypothetical protein